MSRWDSISITAHYTSQVWVRNDLPWAWRFNTLKGRLMYDATKPVFDLTTRKGISTPPIFCIQRHRIIDALLEQLRPAQVVELAGGLSPRCLAYSHKSGVPCVDVDLPGMVRVKARRVGPDAPDSYHLRPLDLVESTDYARDLGDVIQRQTPTVVITEGILPYFSEELQQLIFQRVADLLRFCGGGTYLTDVHHQEAVDRLGKLAAVFRWALHHISGTQQISLIPDFATGQQMMQQAGFTHVRCHRPVEWQQYLGLPQQVLDSGMTVYQARIA